MYIVTLEEQDCPYPSSGTKELSSLESAIEYMRVAYEFGYKIVSLVNTNSFYGKVENENG